MLNDATCFENIFIVCGRTDLRAGIDRLVGIIQSLTDNKAIFSPDTIYLFCGNKTDRIKGIVWEGDGFLMLYKKLDGGRFQWPRNQTEVQNLTKQQFRWLMEGLVIVPKQKVCEVSPQYMI